MKYREFVLKDTVNQKSYRIFRTKIQELKPEVWADIRELPEEMFYDVLVAAAIAADWVEEVEETNEFDDEVTTWQWNQEYVDNLPASGSSPVNDWGLEVFTKWLEIKTLDPN